ncbi:MAG: 1-acyl-sn-glycerol-3-phosphate acyltransferase [Treponema sp.]|jgi:glycerol-3-phosphate O-acyltransferase|nr:1-acyl-sn-glycerol-3-phosphate acyltransferase [Treponema sp.]
METIVTAFGDLIKLAVARSRAAAKVTENNVYQPGNAEIRPLLDKMVETLALPGSGISGMEHIRELYKFLGEGHSCILLLEHYSNLDLSLFDYFLRREAGGGPMADALVAVAGMKLTEENPAVAAFASAYTRLVIYPSRSLQGLNSNLHKEELIRSAAINRAATRTLIRLKETGSLVLVFPAGTRFRPWEPASKRGVREIDSYLRLFDYMCPVAINGELLHVRKGEMIEDYVSKDLVRLTAGPVLSCSAFRNEARTRAEAAGMEDKKQAVVDAVMSLLDGIHNAAEPERQELLTRQNR